ncbi:MAG: ribosome-associated translation inhibitor RaiA [Clostridiales bacterium]|nr:ribosome-associated translation inhibitor RaiA [Bacillota bacterium]MCR5004828.1 ribosome-associated translation inhibitor RaiA [Clostridiales bacterium]
MKFNFTGKQLEVTDSLRAYAEKKVGKIDKFFRYESDAQVTFSRERGRMTAEVTLKNGSRIYRASNTSKDMYASLDTCVSAIERQIRKNKTRLAKNLREGALDDLPEVPQDLWEEEGEFDVVRVKRFDIKPMTVEEAILQMNLLDHQFFVFQNRSEDDAFAVVYRRNNGGYGLIEAEED